MLFLAHFRLVKKLRYLILTWKGASFLSFSLFSVKSLRIRYKSSLQMILLPPEITNLVKNMFTGSDWNFQKMCTATRSRRHVKTQKKKEGGFLKNCTLTSLILTLCSVVNRCHRIDAPFYFHLQGTKAYYVFQEYPTNQVGTHVS